MKNHVVAVCALVRNSKGQVLLINHHQRGWDIPGGYVEPGEDLISAVAREVYEETGVVIANSNLSIVYTNVQSEHNLLGEIIPPKLIFAFECNTVTEDIRPSNENSETIFIGQAQALELVDNDLLNDRLKDLLSNKNGVQYVVYQKVPYRRLKCVKWED